MNGYLKTFYFISKHKHILVPLVLRLKYKIPQLLMTNAILVATIFKKKNDFLHLSLSQMVTLRYARATVVYYRSRLNINAQRTVKSTEIYRIPNDNLLQLKYIFSYSYLN